MKRPKAIILRTAGTNCDVETAHAFEAAGAAADLAHVNRLIRKEKRLKDYQILAIPGGFTYGDDIASGKILANELKYKLKDDIVKFIKAGKIIIGICNGFQVLVKAGFLPNLKGDFKTIDATLSLNDSARFEARWTYLKKVKAQSSKVKTECIWTRGIEDVIYLPVAHGEGKFIPKNRTILDSLKKNGQIVFSYVDENGDSAGYPWNPNGSVEGIAGICDKTGRVFGLMPHPERHICYTNHPRWTREGKKTKGDGLKIFRNGVDFIRLL